MRFINNFLNRKQNMYDFTLCVIACAKKEKYAARLNEFISIYGYKLKNKNLKVKFVYLAEDEPRPSFLNKNDVWYNCLDVPMSMRFLKYIKDCENDSTWVMQVDDDSSTDIDSTFKMLNESYNADDAIMLMGGRNTDLESSQQRILRSMKIDNFFFESSDINKFEQIPYFTHAWEPTIVSKDTIKRIKNWSRLEEYFKLCENDKPVFTDQPIYVVARIAKIATVEAPFLCPFDFASMYSGINKKGRYSHIHYITEKWKYFTVFKKALKDNLVFNTGEEAQKYLSSGSTVSLDPLETISGNTWKFLGNGKLYGLMRFNQDGTIAIYSNDNERYWDLENGSIRLLNKDKKPTSILHKINEDKFEGKFLSDNSIIHKLTRN